MILVYGASGHAKVVIDAIEQSRPGCVIELYDEDIAKHGTEFLGYQIYGGLDSLQARISSQPILVAIGDNQLRSARFQQLLKLGFIGEIIIHPTANIARNVAVGQGTVVFANACINPDTLIGNNVIINTSAVIEHDCRIADNVHIAPGAKICGGVSVGAGTLIGVGANIIPGVQVGKNSIVAAGATVIKDVTDGVIVAGCPAKSIV